MRDDWPRGPQGDSRWIISVLLVEPHDAAVEQFLVYESGGQALIERCLQHAPCAPPEVLPEETSRQLTGAVSPLHDDPAALSHTGPSGTYHPWWAIIRLCNVGRPECRTFSVGRAGWRLWDAVELMGR
ncbi:MAG: hypothetical protein ACK4RV_00910 [Caulobacter sp.]